MDSSLSLWLVTLSVNDSFAGICGVGVDVSDVSHALFHIHPIVQQ